MVSLHKNTNTILNTGLNCTVGGNCYGFYTEILSVSTLVKCAEYFGVKFKFSNIFLSGNYQTVEFDHYDIINEEWVNNPNGWDMSVIYPLRLLPFLLAEYLDMNHGIQKNII